MDNLGDNVETRTIADVLCAAYDKRLLKALTGEEWSATGPKTMFGFKNAEGQVYRTVAVCGATDRRRFWNTCRELELRVESFLQESGQIVQAIWRYPADCTARN